ALLQLGDGCLFEGESRAVAGRGGVRGFGRRRRRLPVAGGEQRAGKDQRDGRSVQLHGGLPVDGPAASRAAAAWARRRLEQRSLFRCPRQFGAGQRPAARAWRARRGRGSTGSRATGPAGARSAGRDRAHGTGRAAPGRGVAAVPPRRRAGATPGTAPGSRRARGPAAVDLGAQLLAQPDLPGRDLDQFVVVDELQRLLERELDRRHQALVVVLAGGAEVGQLLGAQGVDREVVVLAVDADDLALVDLFARFDEQPPALLHRDLRVGRGGAGAVGDQHAVLALAALALHPRTVVVEHVEQQAGAGGQGAELGLEADQAARRDDVVEAHAALAVRLHVLQQALALAEAAHDAALVLLVHVHDQRLVRLLHLAVDLAHDHLGAGHGQFVALAAHG